MLPIELTETRAAKVERLLGTIPKIDRASAPSFNYDAATKIAKNS